MTYDLFITLYSEALEYSDVDLYIAERGWQDWMDDYDGSIGEALAMIYTLATNNIKSNRQLAGLSRAAFSRQYRIPIRTAENWEATGDNARELPSYTKTLIDYSLFLGI